MTATYQAQVSTCLYSLSKSVIYQAQVSTCLYSLSKSVIYQAQVSTCLYFLSKSITASQPLFPWLPHLTKIPVSLKVRPHYAARHTAAKCGKATWQKLRHAASICGRCIGLAAACRSMLRGLKIRSANCRSHQKKPRGI